ncbi:hypothetical protein EVG20_g4817 [Dentipellis fragilis]|uniref:Ubiquitin-like domain-containing protein n=1 Tax=Dentipellis fragilis TaxID=205917 RepID=A0A4Y9YXH6_9AGAM|nr:hypothetical protein EVG20_g4817 [Dentipellis fragilis]
MSFAVFTFGSFGDIITVVQLLNQVRRTLCDSTGSAAEYQALIADLDVFANVLSAVNDAFQPGSSESARPSRPHRVNGTLPPSIMNARRQALRTSYDLLRDIQRRISGYQASLKTGGSGSMMADSWRKIGWALFKQSELKEIRRRVMDQVEVLNILMSLLSREQSTVLYDIQRVLRELPLSLGYTWEGGHTSLQQPVVLMDAFDRILILPFDLCDTWERFVGLLKVYFKGRPGAKQVDNYHFIVTPSADPDLLIFKSSWSQHVRPGARLGMEVLIPRFNADPEMQVGVKSALEYLHSGPGGGCVVKTTPWLGNRRLPSKTTQRITALPRPERREHAGVGTEVDSNRSRPGVRVMVLFVALHPAAPSGYSQSHEGYIRLGRDSRIDPHARCGRLSHLPSTYLSFLENFSH